MSHRRRRCSIFLFFSFSRDLLGKHGEGEGARIPTLFHLFPAVSCLRQSAPAVSEKTFFKKIPTCLVKPVCVYAFICQKKIWEEKGSHTLGSKGRGQKPDNYCPFAGRKGEHLTSLLLSSHGISRGMPPPSNTRTSRHLEDTARRRRIWGSWKGSGSL